MAVKAGLEHGLHGAHAQVTEQGGIVHSVKAGACFAAVDGFPASWKDESISFTPEKNLTTGFGLPMASGHEEQLTGCIRIGAHGPLIQAHEIAAERWTRGRSFAVQLFAEIQRHELIAGLVNKIGWKTPLGDSADQSLLQWVGGRAVVEKLGLSTGGRTRLWGDRRPSLNTTGQRRVLWHLTSRSFVAAVASVALR